jgi:hypothetical protein
VNDVEVTEVNPANVVEDDPRDMAVEPTVTELFTKLAFVTVADAISPPTIVPSTIIADVTLPLPIADTPPAVIVISPLTLLKIELE